jgi:N-acetylglucosaminyl-diphospho-decaprenol L-rhamnosyltransferase
MKKTGNELTVSIVSHGHSDFVFALLDQLACSPLRQLITVILTVNLPALDAFDEIRLARNFFAKLILLKNSTPKGFGANHNQAFGHCTTDFFCAVNPDIELVNDPFAGLFEAFTASNVGLVYPSQVDQKSVALDFERCIVSPSSIAQRHLLRQNGTSNCINQVDWVSGSFMMFKSSVFRELSGFDEGYFMYCEDVDLCLRLQLAGYTLARADATVIHHTQRQTLKNPQHLAWHIRSLLRLWNSAAYKEYKKKFIESR